jgi:hypothetical protein
MAGRSSSPPGSDETPTPNTSSSFAFFHDAAKLLADRFESVASLKRRHLQALDIVGANECDRLAHELRRMAERFATWPTNPETVATERPVLAPRLMELTRIEADIVAGLPEDARARLK